jgi:membrane protein YdbS with pleckstrin-like domain
MLKRLNSKIIIALCTSSAIIAFAFYRRQEASVMVSAVAFYCAAAVICLLPVIHALYRHQICRNKGAKSD